MFILLASLVLGACSSDDDNNVNDPKNAAYTETTVTEAPAWQIDWSNNQEHPNWTEPDGSLYANWTILKVQIEDALKAYGNETGSETVNMSLQYYSSTLKHLFTLTDNITLDADETTGFDEAFVPEFTLGSAKYPVQKTVDVEPLLTKVGLTPVSGNMVAAFVGEECRGTVSLASSGSTQLLIFGRNNGESVTLKCYDAVAGKLYTIPDAVKL